MLGQRRIGWRITALGHIPFSHPSLCSFIPIEGRTFYKAGLGRLLQARESLTEWEQFQRKLKYQQNPMYSAHCRVHKSRGGRNMQSWNNHNIISASISFHFKLWFFPLGCILALIFGAAASQLCRVLFICQCLRQSISFPNTNEMIYYTMRAGRMEQIDCCLRKMIFPKT